MEFLIFVLMFSAAYPVWRKPQREGLAYGLLVACVLLMVTVYLFATRSSVLPGLNY
jgi:hypothetical protein